MSLPVDEQTYQKLLKEADAFKRLPFVPGISLPPDHAPRAEDMPEPPDKAGCELLLDKYGVPPHIRRHSRQVTFVLADLGELAIARGARLSRPVLIAGGLLHDVAKMYTVNFPGDHAQIGAAVALRETRNYRVAQMVYHHVEWPWAVDVYNDEALYVLLLVYADKRVKHESIVPLNERFSDLFQRYGHTGRARAYLAHAHRQGVEIEKALSERLEVRISEYSFDSGRLV